MQGFYKKLYANKFENLEEMNQFLGKNPNKRTQEVEKSEYPISS